MGSTVGTINRTARVSVVRLNLKEAAGKTLARRTEISHFFAENRSFHVVPPFQAGNEPPITGRLQKKLFFFLTVVPGMSYISILSSVKLRGKFRGAPGDTVGHFVMSAFDVKCLFFRLL